jgi:formylmethanofuran dehydrogenase subunit E
MRWASRSIVLLAFGGVLACASATEPHAPHALLRIDPVEQKLDAVAAVHGAPGPWAVAGYRMSEYALTRLELSRGSFDLVVTHHSPKEVRFSCIADGVAAQSGASVGKLNLTVEESLEKDLRTTYRNKRTGRSLTLRPTEAFRSRYADTPRERARQLGREVLELPEHLVFEELSEP